MKSVHKTKGKHVFGAIVLLSLIVLAGSIVYVRQERFDRNVRAEEFVSLSFYQKEIETSVGKQFRVLVMLDTKDKKITAADVELKYDPDVIEIVDIDQKHFLPVTLRGLFKTENSSGFTFAAKPDSPVTGSGGLSDITFKALKETALTHISLGSNTQVAVLGETKLPITEYQSGLVKVSIASQSAQ